MTGIFGLPPLVLPFAAVATVALLYLIRRPPRAVLVPSLLLFRPVADRHRRRSWLRRLLSCLLSLLVAAAMALALSGLPRAARSGGVQLVVVDDSATMGAEVAPGTTRLDVARARALELALAWSGSTLLADTTGRAAPVTAHSADQAKRWLAELETAAVAPRVPGFERTAPREPPPARQILVTDGVALGAPDGWIVESVFAPVRNVGIVSFAPEPAPAPGAAAVATWIEIRNGSPESVTSRLVVERGDGKVLLDQGLELRPRETWSGVLDVATPRGGELRLAARVETAGDAFAADDRSTMRISVRPPLRIGLVGPRGALDRAVRLLPGTSVVALAPEEAARASAGGRTDIDVVVADGWAPESAPRIPALLVAPPTRPWLPEPAETRESAVLRAHDPQGRDWGPLAIPELRVFRFETAPDGPTAPSSADVLLAGELAEVAAGSREELPLAFALRGLDVPVVVIAAPLAATGLASHEAFPVLVTELIDRIAAPARAETNASEAPASPTSAADPNDSALPPDPALGSRLELEHPLLGTRSQAFTRERLALTMLLFAGLAAALETWTRSRGLTE